MTEIIITTQQELDAISEIKVEERVVIRAALRLSRKIQISGELITEKSVDCNFGEDRYFEARGDSAPVIEAWGDSAPRIVAWESSAPRIVAWGSSAPLIEAWESSVVQAIEIALSAQAKINLFGFASISIPFNLKAKITKSKTAHIQRVKKIRDWFENNSIRRTKNIMLFKRVSKDFKTQEGSRRETDWTPGKTVVHPAWKPKDAECGPDKYHGCSRPYFADEFRSDAGDRYVAIRVPLVDTYAWPNPVYPHKIAFRTGTVLYECDRFGEKIGK